jgi:hypothetical protein
MRLFVRCLELVQWPEICILLDRNRQFRRKIVGDTRGLREIKVFDAIA